MNDPAPNTCHSLGCSAPVSSPGEWCPSCIAELEKERYIKAWIAGFYAQQGVPRG